MLLRRPSQMLLSPITAFSDHTSPLERNPLSRKGWKKKDSDGVGLSIVTKLEVNGGVRRRILLVGDSTTPISIGEVRVSEVRCVCKRSAMAVGDFPIADFLSCCYLCRKRLQGKDIFMYRGDKAFCSKECRYQQIVSDEWLEKCGSDALRMVDVSRTPCCSNGDVRLFLGGGVAAA